MVLLYNLFEGVSTIPVLPQLFHVNNPPNLVGLCVYRVLFWVALLLL